MCVRPTAEAVEEAPAGEGAIPPKAGAATTGALSAWLAIAACAVGLAVRLAVCHTTHALTATVDACRTLCELLALLACIFANKHEKGSSSNNRLYNSTYGLSRGTVLASLISRVLFASFSLALTVAALQAVCASAGDEGAPHAPQVLLASGGAFALFAVLRCLLRCILSRRSPHFSHTLLLSAPTDLISSIFVAISAAAAIAGGNELARLADPVLAAAACLVLVCLDYSEMKLSGLVLLQASPHSVIHPTLHTALEEIQGVYAIHELHTWQLTPACYVATVHIVYESQIDYMKTWTIITEMFIKLGFTYVTIQPEFRNTAPSAPLVWCAWDAACSNAALCGPKRCCCPQPPDIVPVSVVTKQ